MTRTISSTFSTLAVAGALTLSACASHGRSTLAESSPANPIAAASSDDTPLEAGALFERAIARGDEHRYAVDLIAGAYASVILDQHGVDVVVETRRPDGRVLAEFQEDITGGGEERAEIVAETAGRYTVVVRPAPGVAVAGGYALRVGSRRTAKPADRSMQEAWQLRTTAARLYDQDDLAGAAPLFERALTLTETLRGADDKQVADVATQLASVYLDLLDTAKVESLYQRALVILDNALGTDHPSPAFVRSRLAKLYQVTGERAKAEALIRPALETLERTLGTQNVWFVRAVGVLASLRVEAGDTEQTESILRRQQSILEAIGYTDSMLYAGVLNNLGDVSGRRRDFVHAEDFLQRSLALGERLRGPHNAFIVNPLNNLGIVARQQKEYAKAEAYYTRALTIRQRIVGPEHGELVLLLVNIANIYAASGDSARSLETLHHAFQIAEKAYGPYHRNTLLAAGNLARVYTASGDTVNAVAFQQRADAIVETQLALNLAIGSERQKFVFANSIAERTERTISLSLNAAAGNPDATALAALVLMQRKGRVLDAMGDTFAGARQRMADSADRALLDQLNATTAQLARIALNQRDETAQGERRDVIKDLETRKERFEAALSDRSGEWRARTAAVTLDAVQAAMPDGAALIEFAIFRPFDAAAERNVDAYGPPHYAAYVIPKHGAARGVDLGLSAAIDGAVGAFRQALRDPTRVDVTSLGRALDERIMRPLRPTFGTATQLLISPDGLLNLVPFEALVDERGRYLIERFAASYLTSGRDLLRLQVSRAPLTEAVIVADPIFGEPARPTSEETIDASTGRRAGTSGSSGRETEMYFAPLGATAEEARAIKALFPQATLLTGRRATKAVVQQLEAPRMLHIASHGFFLPDPSRATDAQSSTVPPGSTRSISTSGSIENPLLRAGLALAGANLTHEQERGILTALEASSLNLWGTKLVTLSACDTGVGEVRNGEGVYGLRRAFVLAGTETLVMSLWPVSDYVSRETMVSYYTGLRAGLGRGDALRQAKLAMLKRTSRRHPFYWASFIQSGEWGNLDGHR